VRHNADVGWFRDSKLQHAGKTKNSRTKTSRRSIQIKVGLSLSLVVDYRYRFESTLPINSMDGRAYSYYLSCIFWLNAIKII